jgi:hypothetical protein
LLISLRSPSGDAGKLQGAASCQRFAIYLAVGALGQGVAQQDIARHHEVFQPPGEFMAELAIVLRFAYEWRFSDGASRVGARTAASL